MAKTVIAQIPGGVQGQDNEHSLSMAAEIIMNQIYYRTNLPKLLAQLALKGEKDKVLSAVVAWGSGEKPLEEIWQDCCTAMEKKKSNQKEKEGAINV